MRYLGPMGSHLVPLSILGGSIRLGINIGTGCRNHERRAIGIDLHQTLYLYSTSGSMYSSTLMLPRRKTMFVGCMVCKKGSRTVRCNSTPDKTKYSGIWLSRRARMRRAEPPRRLSARESRGTFCVEIITRGAFKQGVPFCTRPTANQEDFGSCWRSR